MQKPEGQWRFRRYSKSGNQTVTDGLSVAGE